MNNKSLEELLDNLFVSELSPPLTDAVVDAYLTACDKHPPEGIQAMRIRFVEKSLANMYKTPVKKIDERISFGSWIKETRKKAHLTQKDISMSVLEDASYINDIENSHMFPWQLNTENIARLIILFRIHFDALIDLFHTSFAICKNQDKLGISARTGKNENRSKSQDAIRKALEIHLSNREGSKLSDEIQHFLDSLKDELKEKDAINLIT